mmetsp:Transcript_21231/g.50341  ORF Transcript_21231/g.50341 Transcript_21231/m.50341 type:complete len:357 (+) Transcript_21231:1-1071(+)
MGTVVVSTVSRFFARLRGEDPNRVDADEDSEDGSSTCSTSTSCSVLYDKFVEATNKWESLQFTTGDYRPKYFFWDVVEMSRKLLMTSLIVLIVQYVPGYDLIIGFTFSVAFLLLHAITLPYKKRDLNMVKTCLEAVGFLTITFLLVFTQTSTVDEYSGGIDVVLYMFNVGIFVFILLGNRVELMKLYGALKAEYIHRRQDIPRSPYKSDGYKWLVRTLAVARVSIVLKRRIRERRAAKAAAVEESNAIASQVQQWLTDAGLNVELAMKDVEVDPPAHGPPAAFKTASSDDGPIDPSVLFPLGIAQGDSFKLEQSPQSPQPFVPPEASPQPDADDEAVANWWMRFLTDGNDDGFGEV